MLFFTYIIKSDIDGSYFYGQTNNLQRRLNQHNRGLEKTTRHLRPWKLLAYKDFETREAAMSLERRLKLMNTANDVENFIKVHGFHFS